MRDKLVLWFLGFLETMKYILEQSHGVPPVSVVLDHTTLKEEGSCGYSSVKTVHSIEKMVASLYRVHSLFGRTKAFVVSRIRLRNLACTRYRDTTPQKTGADMPRSQPASAGVGASVHTQPAAGLPPSRHFPPAPPGFTG
jgi:hypothetical protein